MAIAWPGVLECVSWGIVLNRVDCKLMRTVVIDTHAVAKGALVEVLFCVPGDGVDDRATRQWHVLDAKGGWLRIGVFAVGK